MELKFGFSDLIAFSITLIITVIYLLFLFKTKFYKKFYKKLIQQKNEKKWHYIIRRLDRGEPEKLVFMIPLLIFVGLIYLFHIKEGGYWFLTVPLGLVFGSILAYKFRKS